MPSPVIPTETPTMTKVLLQNAAISAHNQKQLLSGLYVKKEKNGVASTLSTFSL